jgi:nitroimidazol reductase NimA-like FMN-containing flavoprotein (pyridoxamine 5'-phosphate oxidase superfamily)
MVLESSMLYGSWSGAQIETFLKQTRIPLRLSMMSSAGLLIVPVWFQYQNNTFLSCSPQESLLVQSLNKNPQIAFDISTNELPYQGVRGRGVAHCVEATDNATLESLLTRYVAGTDNTLARWLLNRKGPEALIEIQLTWLTSWDFSERMHDVEKIAARFPTQPL